jgi:hypothetical protein
MAWSPVPTVSRPSFGVRGLLIFALTASLVAAGCGDDDDTPDGTTPVAARIPTVRPDGLPVRPETGLPLRINALTKSEYLARSNKVCRESWVAMLQEFDRYKRERGSSETDAELFAYVSKNSLLSFIQFWFDDISYLGAPKGEKQQVEQMLEALQLAVFGGEEQRISNPALFSAVFSSFNRLASEYGLDECVVDEKDFRSVT